MNILSVYSFLLVVSFIQLIENSVSAPGQKDVEIYAEQKKRLDMVRFRNLTFFFLNFMKAMAK